MAEEHVRHKIHSPKEGSHEKMAKKKSEILYIGNDCMCILLTVSGKIVPINLFTLEEMLPSSSTTTLQKQDPTFGISAFDDRFNRQIIGL